ncbi:MAG: FAD-dependent oxidoreductase [Phycisphaerales bacterium]
MKDITAIPKYRRFNTREHGCELWWIEHGGLLDTVHDAERIKWELWQIVYGVWDHIKNSGEFPEAETLTLEWVGMIPGKRESRRFEGDYMLSQRDIVERRRHDDAVSFGGWAIDLHPAEGVYGDGPSCTQWHSKGVFQVPYRCLYSRNIRNLFLAGRIISASHVAFGSTRVMATCAHSAQAVGAAAALCMERGLEPRDLLDASHMSKLQSRLLRLGQHIPGIDRNELADLVPQAEVSASSSFSLRRLEPDAEYLPLTCSHAMLIPVRAGRVPKIGFWFLADGPTEIEAQLRIAGRKGGFTPDVELARRYVEIQPTVLATKIATVGRTTTYASVSGAPGRAGIGSDRTLGEVTQSPVSVVAKQVIFDFDYRLEEEQYVFVCLMENPLVSVQQSDGLVSGVLRLSHRQGRRVSVGAIQEPPEGSGIDSFEFWLPGRRPHGKSLAMVLDPPVDCFGPENVARFPDRPTTRPNAWVADPADPSPRIQFSWPTQQNIRRLEFVFDTDADHPMETVLMSHPESVMPACVRNLRVKDDSGRVIGTITDNHQTRRTLLLDEPVVTRSITIEVDHPGGRVPAALFHVRCYET